ncbi:alpha/beta hydrolase [Pleurocapsa sp. FMAR1]|uniref:alpha/beta hydrolase n=1 Tax=Pleurocapsa sp. FMAR1 TaxID=3040204 RepID=UPI0029C7E074|nr:alpha/beta hydrolase [Pleurocapsa sp. FMAR1]
MIFSLFISSIANQSTLKSNRHRSRSKIAHLGSYIALGALQVVCSLGLIGYWTKKAVAAEEIVLSYGALEFPVSIKSLETYATTGKIEGELASYAGFLTPEQLQKFKVGLTTSADFDHLAIAQFLYSFQGEKILDRVSKVIKTKARQPGFYAIRSALILAAADAEDGGLTPLNVLKKFPTKILRIDSRQGLEIIKDLSQVVKGNQRAIAAVQAEATKESQLAVTAPKTINSDLLSPGKYSYRKELLTMKDSRRDDPSGRSRERTFPVELYLPKVKNRQPLPLIIISHGLGSDLTTFAYFAKHLASHGFAVAVPEHPGSSARQIQALLNGLVRDVTPPKELIDRPLDIKFVLDYIARNYGKKIDTNNVGMIGQSFGAYTALAIAGAELNWQTLNRDCTNLDDSWNLSLLLQCLALQIPVVETGVNLRDERIKAAVAINPLTSSVFGEQGLSKIKIPVMLVSGSADPVTPSLSEQIIPFTWLKTPKKYLVLLEGGTHFSTLNESAGSIPVPPQAIGPDPKIAQGYVKQLGLAFFSTYITNEPTYAQYLNAQYGSIISKPAMPLSLIEFLDSESLQLN